MPVIEWGSCLNCGRSCAGPHGSFCSDVCREVYRNKQNPTPAKPDDFPTGKVPRGGGGMPPPKKGGKCSIVLGGGLAGLGGVVYALVKILR